MSAVMHPWNLHRPTQLRINQIIGRARELIEQGRLVEDGRRRCKVTGNEVNVVRVAVDLCAAVPVRPNSRRGMIEV